MSDATGGAAAAALAGAPGDNATPGATGPAATVPQLTPGATGPGAAANDGSWTKEWDPADAGIVEKKGWKSPAELFKSYRELEKTLGSDKLVAPKDANDSEALNKIYARLGRPESPDKYTFPEGVDAEAIKVLAPELHKLGLSQAQAEGLAKLDIGRQQQAVQAQLQAAQADQTQAMQKLESEWGSKTPEMIEHNRRAMRAFGISVDQATAMMAAAGAGGSERLMRLLNAAGKAMREDGAFNLKDDTDLGFGMSKNRAAAEIQQLKGDHDFMAKLQRGDNLANARWDQLQKQRSGEA